MSVSIAPNPVNISQAPKWKVRRGELMLTIRSKSPSNLQQCIDAQLWITGNDRGMRQGSSVRKERVHWPYIGYTVVSAYGRAAVERGVRKWPSNRVGLSGLML